MAERHLGLAPAIDPSARIVECHLGRYTEIGPRTRLTESVLDDYSYIAQDGEVIYTAIGKFCSIAASVRINPGNHPMERASQAHFTYRAHAYWPEEADEDAFFARRRASPVTIGHDVWIGHGVVVLPGRTVGTGAVVGGGGDRHAGCPGLHDRRRQSGPAGAPPLSRADRRAAGASRLVGLGPRAPAPGASGLPRASHRRLSGAVRELGGSVALRHVERTPRRRTVCPRGGTRERQRTLKTRLRLRLIVPIRASSGAIGSRSSRGSMRATPKIRTLRHQHPPERALIAH